MVWHNPRLCSCPWGVCAPRGKGGGHLPPTGFQEMGGRRGSREGEARSLGLGWCREMGRSLGRAQRLPALGKPQGRRGPWGWALAGGRSAHCVPTPYRAGGPGGRPPAAQIWRSSAAPSALCLAWGALPRRSRSTVQRHKPRPAASIGSRTKAPGVGLRGLAPPPCGPIPGASSGAAASAPPPRGRAGTQQPGRS